MILPEQLPELRAFARAEKDLTFARHCRTNALSREEYRRLDRRFWKDVEEGLLTIRQSGQREYLKALHLLEHAGVNLGKKITTFDALIAATCLEFALVAAARVVFCLEDRKLYKVISGLAAYNSVLDFRYIGPPV